VRRERIDLRVPPLYLCVARRARRSHQDSTPGKAGRLTHGGRGNETTDLQ
jgi:hypothetical protein